MKVGIDMERVERMDEKLLEKISTQKEREYIARFAQKKEHIASLWCAKEATTKLLGDEGISFLEIELLHAKNGRPFLNLLGRAREVAQSQGLKNFDISISHSSGMAIAIVIAE